MLRRLLLLCLAPAAYALHVTAAPRGHHGRVSEQPRMLAAAPAPPLALMVNGLPGAMGVEIAAACLRRGVELAPFALTGDIIDQEEITVDDGRGGPQHVVRLYRASDREALAAAAKAAYPMPGSLVCIDFTHPTAVNANAEWYVQHALPFVMGTTGGDRDALMTCVGDAGLHCVIAPNMAKQIVALQAALEHMASEFPGSFDGYALRVVESHQATKADTSGTAKAISAHLARLNSDEAFTNESIERVRETEQQLAGGGVSHTGVSPVPEGALNGHAYHTYSLTSADGQVEFQFRHNVNGRSTYAEGTVDAGVFLATRIAAASEQRVFSMIDVLKAGAM
uniref:4-hydroxy-tetrahydrodipicolinate reductase n=1 Tax=Prymnesium polylepis TaxID=72548 RepID=A0A7S4IU05_9EUKA